MSSLPNCDEYACENKVIRKSSLNSNEHGNCCHIWKKKTMHAFTSFNNLLLFCLRSSFSDTVKPHYKHLCY